MKQILHTSTRWAGKWLTYVGLLWGLLMMPLVGYGQVTASGSGLAASYGSLAAAITALNTVGTATSTTTITVTVDQTAPVGGYNITATGTAANKITIKGDGMTRLLTASGSQTSGSVTDAIIKIVGGDYITIDGFTLQENTANTTIAVGTNNMTEFGIALFNASATNGAQNNTIQNNTVTLGATYPNTIGIYANCTTTAATATSGTNSNNKVYSNNISNVQSGIYWLAPPQTVTIFESGNDIGGSSIATANTISFGVANTAFTWTAPTSFSFATQAGIYFRNAVGSSIRFNTISNPSTFTIAVAGVFHASGTTPTGITYTTTISDNTITLNSTGTTAITGIDFGSGLSTGTIAGSNNTITLNQNSTVAVSATINGISAAYTGASSNLNGNNITINQSHNVSVSSANSSPVTAIAMPLGTTGTPTMTAQSNIILINRTNTASALLATCTMSGAITGISAITSTSTLTIGSAGNANTITVREAIAGLGTNTYSSTINYVNLGASGHTTININNNTFNTTSSTIRSTGALNCVNQGATTGTTSTTNVKSNTVSIDRIANTGSVGFFTQTSTSPNDPADDISSNNITFTSLAGSSSVIAIQKLGGLITANRTINSNTISITGTQTGTNTGISYAYSTLTTASNNSITISCAAPTVIGITATNNNTATTASSNVISLISSATSTTSMQGISLAGSGAHSVSANTFTALNFTGVITTGGITSAIAVGGGTGANIFSNEIANISVGAGGSTGSPLIDGILISGGASVNVYKNKIYGISTQATGTTIALSGIRISGGTTNNVYNNLIGNLTSPASASVHGIRGINITSTTTSTTQNIYYNTIFLNATSSGANFGTSGIFHQSSATATTSALNLRNNIIVNTSTANGTGFTVAHRRADINNANFATTSNNNLLYAGVPSATNLIMYNSTASYQTLASYQGILSGGKESTSVSELPTWQSTTGSSADFLKYSTTVASLADNAGTNISGYTDDFAGTTRSATIPDMGAWELTITPVITVADNTQITAGSINQGSLKNPLSRFTVAVDSRANATLNTITIPMSGTYTASDIQTSGFKLWYNTTTNDINNAGTTAFTGVSSVSGSGETITFSGLNYTIIKGTTIYFWITADISATATGGNTINANALAPANFTFALGTPTGSVSVAGTQTIAVATPTIALANSGAPAINPVQGINNVVLYRVDLTVGVTAATLSTAQFTTAGTYVASDVSNFKIWYHNNTDFTVGTPVLIATIPASGAGLQSFTGLSRNYPIGTNYLFLTTDLPCTSTVSNTISINATANTDFTFVAGTPTGTGYTDSGTVTINAVTVNNATAVTPTAGNTQVSLAWTAPTGCVSEVMIVVAPLVTNSGTPTGDGTTYTGNLAYPSGTGLGNGFVAYKGNTSPQVITGLTNFTTYFFKIFTRNGSTWSSGIEVSATPVPNYCNTSLHSTTNDHVTNATIPTTTLNSSNGLGAGGYTLVPSTPSSNTASLEQGITYSLNLTIPSCTPTQTAVWIDFNKNGTFEATEYFLAGTCASNLATISVNIPMAAPLGLTRMRIRTRGAAFANTDACTSFPSGETEDYTITITPATPETLGTLISTQATPATINKNTTNNPILRIDLPTIGSLGTLTLTNLIVTSANVSDADVATNGVKLYYTTTTTFSTANPVGTGQSFSGGVATFSGLTRLLASGNNYIWVAYDVATTATVSNTLDAQVAIGNMTIAESGGANATGTIPASALNPTGSIQIIPRAPLALSATAFSNTQINLSNNANTDSDNIMVAWNSSNTFGTPTGTYTAGNSIAGGGTVLYVGTVAGLVNHTGLTANTQYFYRVWTNGGTAYSTTFQNANATTLPNPLNYVFSQSNGTYSEITPTTVLYSGASLDDNVSASQSITSFTYNGVSYTNMFVSTNGFLKLGGATGPADNNYTPLSTVSTAYQNIIAAFGQDLVGIDATSNVGWSTIGNEVIVQWKNVKRYYLTAVTETVNFQIRLNTSTGNINIVYGTCTAGTNDTNKMQIGLRGFDETWRTQILNREHNLNWDRTTMGTANTTVLPFTSTIAPTSGLTFTYTPNTCTPFPLIGAVTQSGANVTVNWTAQAEATDGYDVRYRLQSAGIGTYIVVNVAGQATNNTVIAGLSAGTYLFEVRSRCSGTTFSDYSNAVILNVVGDFYLKSGGIITNTADWGTNTDGTGTNPTLITQANTNWNIRNNTAVTNPATWLLGSTSKIIVGDGVTATNFTLPAGQNVTGTIDVANLGTLSLQNTINPTFGALAVGSTVDYSGTGAQTIALTSYSNLTISGARVGSPIVTLPVGTINIAGTFAITTTGVGGYTNTGNTINFSGAGMQTIPAFTYRGITNTGNGNRTLESSGEINIAGTFALGTGTYTTTGSTVNYSATTGGGFSMISFNYHNLIFSGTQTYSIGAGNTMNVANDFTLNGATFNVSNTAGTSTLAVAGNVNIIGGTFNVANSSGTAICTVGNDLTLSGGLLRVISNSSAPNTTLNISRDFVIAGAGRIILESLGASASRSAVVNVGRDFISTGTSLPSSGADGIVDFASSGVAADNNAVNIVRNFNHSGTGRFGTGAVSQPLGFVFNGGGTLQTFSYTGSLTSQFVPYVVNSNSYLQMLSNHTLPLGTTTRSNFTVNTGATLDMGTRVISTNNATDATFTLASGATIKTAHASGLTSNFSGFTAGTTLLLNSGSNYEFNGTVAQITSAFVTTPTANRVNNLTINNSAGITLTSSLTATNTLTMTAGNINTGANVLTLGTSPASTGTLAYNAGTIIGQFKRWIGASATGYDFPIGVATQTRNANITYTGAPTTGGSLTAQFIAGTSGTSGLPVTEGAITVTNVFQGVWQINAADGLIDGTYTATINAFNISGITQFANLVMLKRANNASAWIPQGTHVTTTGSNGAPVLQRTGLTGFSEFGVGGGETNPLPITLLGLKGKRVEGLNGDLTEEVKLSWTTASELNNKGFEVEVAEDAINFRKIAFVEGAGNSTNSINYQLSTNNPNDGYYRLRQVDFDGKFTYSPIVFVEGMAGKVMVYPNPNSGVFSISVGKGKLDLPARLLNAQGKECPLTPEGGMFRVKESLPTGIYFLHTVVAGKATVTKVIIK